MPVKSIDQRIRELQAKKEKQEKRLAAKKQIEQARATLKSLRGK